MIQPKYKFGQDVFIRIPGGMIVRQVEAIKFVRIAATGAHEPVYMYLWDYDYDLKSNRCEMEWHLFGSEQDLKKAVEAEEYRAKQACECLAHLQDERAKNAARTR